MLFLIGKDKGMRIYGFQKTTLLDYPGHVAATVFTGGCNFRCPFCHNAGLVLGVERRELKAVELEAAEVDACAAKQEQKSSVALRSREGAMDEAEVLAYLRKRRGILQGVCITGGEPTLQEDLEEFIGRVKELGYLVKLDTNGYRPEVLERLLKAGLPDYVAMDIKASKENYGRAAGVAKPDIAGIEESVNLLKNSTIPYEFRTTVVKGIHSIEEFDAIGSWLAGSKAYYLQAFRENEDLLGSHTEKDTLAIAVFSKAEMEQMAELARKYIDKVMLRGVE